MHPTFPFPLPATCPLCTPPRLTNKQTFALQFPTQHDLSTTLAHRSTATNTEVTRSCENSPHFVAMSTVCHNNNYNTRARCQRKNRNTPWCNGRHHAQTPFQQRSTQPSQNLCRFHAGKHGTRARPLPNPLERILLHHSETRPCAAGCGNTT
jgi:hypothetical protein